MDALQIIKFPSYFNPNILYVDLNFPLECVNSILGIVESEFASANKRSPSDKNDAPSGKNGSGWPRETILVLPE